MIKVKQYIKLLEVLSRCLRHPKMLDYLDMEAAILYALDFMHIVGVPDMFEDKEVVIEIHNHRGELPCDIVSVTLVINDRTHLCMRSTTDEFSPHEKPCHMDRCEDTFKLLNTIIVTSFKEGTVRVSYTATPVDENGFPLLIDNPTYLKALELYIKKEVFTMLFDDDKIKIGVLQNVLLEYAWKVGLLLSEMTIPSMSEMESIRRSWCTLILRTNDFNSGWKHLGDTEHYRRH